MRKEKPETVRIRYVGPSDQLDVGGQIIPWGRIAEVDKACLPAIQDVVEVVSSSAEEAGSPVPNGGQLDSGTKPSSVRRPDLEEVTNG